MPTTITTMAKPLTDDEKAVIVEAIEAGEPRNEIARRHQRSAGTITRIAQAHGLSFDRSKTKTATQAKVADNEAALAELRAELIADARRLRAELWEPCVEKKPMVVSDGAQVGSHVEVVEVHYDRPPFADKQRIMTSVGIAVDKAIGIDRHSRRDEDQSAVDRWLTGIIEGAAA